MYFCFLVNKTQAQVTNEDTKPLGTQKGIAPFLSKILPITLRLWQRFRAILSKISVFSP